MNPSQTSPPPQPPRRRPWRRYVVGVLAVVAGVYFLDENRLSSPGPEPVAQDFEPAEDSMKPLPSSTPAPASTPPQTVAP